MTMISSNRAEARVTEQPDLTPTKAPGASWADRVRTLVGPKGERGANLAGLVLGTLFVCGMAFLLVTWIFGAAGTADPALVGSWHTGPIARHPLDVVVTPRPSLALVLKEDGSYQRMQVINNKTDNENGTWWVTDGRLHLRGSRSFLGLTLPGTIRSYEYRLSDYRPIDKSLGRGLDLTDTKMKLGGYSLVDDAALKKAIENLARPR